MTDAAAELAELYEKAGSVDPQEQTAACERAADLALRIADLPTATEVLDRLGSLLPAAAQVWLDTWCLSFALPDPLLGMDLALAGSGWIEPDSDVRPALAAKVLSAADPPPAHIETAVVWFAEKDTFADVAERAQVRLVDVACSGNPEDEDSASAAALHCLRQIPEWKREARKVLVEHLLCLHGSPWPECLLDRSVDIKGAERVRRALAKRLQQANGRCVLGNTARCTKVTHPRPVMFVAHPFGDQPEEHPLRSVMGLVKESLTGLNVEYADEFLDEGTLACAICLAVRQARIAIFDLTPECPSPSAGTCVQGKVTKANPNVAFELGLALARGTNSVLISRKGTRPLADVSNHRRIEFADYAELPDKLVKRIRKLLAKERV